MGTLDTDDMNRVYEELTTSSQNYKFKNITLLKVNWRLLLLTYKIEEDMLLAFKSPLLGGFHAPMKRKTKDIDPIKCGVAIGD